MALYYNAFHKHIPASCTPTSTLENVLRALQASKLSDRTKTLLPSLQQVETTCRNVTWVVHYWKDCLNCQPDLTQPHQFGFAFDASTRQYTWTDMVTCSAMAQQPHNTQHHPPNPLKRMAAGVDDNAPSQREGEEEEEPCMLIPIDPTINVTLS
eukprot:3936518-Rhodomonas_salina.1